MMEFSVAQMSPRLNVGFKHLSVASHLKVRNTDILLIYFMLFISLYFT